MTSLFTAVAIEQLEERGKLAPRTVGQAQIGRGSARLMASIRLVERVSGESYAAYLERHMFRPLGMTHTDVRGSGAILEVYSTVDDLDRWNQAVLFSAPGPGNQVLEAIDTQRGAAAGERLVLGPDTAVIVLANQGAGVGHLLTAIQNALAA